MYTNPSLSRKVAFLESIAEPLSGISYRATEQLSLLKVCFEDFRDFACYGMKFLGFSLTDMQADIAHYLQTGPKKKMILAQRGEAKSTLTALYGVWSLIMEPRTRVLIISAAGRQASELATLIVRLIEHWPILNCMKANKCQGDRSSYCSYDINNALKPLDKSPSIACIGITASLQGKRADVLIADDIESTKNGYSQTERDKLLNTSKDFSGICTHGQIIYLGTYQTRQSIYKTLPNRGFDIRIWPGRVPSDKAIRTYGHTLAPYVLALSQRFKQSGYGVSGDRGESADPERYTEDILLEKELDWGPEGFELQYMLNADLSDASRARIKVQDILVLSSGSTTQAPSQVSITGTYRCQQIGKDLSQCSPTDSAMLVPYEHKIMVIDPAGCRGDEVSYCVGGSAASYIHLFSVGGLQGGVTNDNIDWLLNLASLLGVSDIVIESNMGHGTVRSLFLNRMNETGIVMGCRDLYNTAQKERRIIDTLSPVLRRHKLIVHAECLERDKLDCLKYSADKRWQYSLFTQLDLITYDKGCLTKDDRADAAAMLVQELNKHLIKDSDSLLSSIHQKEMEEFVLNPLGYVNTRSTVRSQRRRRY
ncbi:phage terminase large subunit [Rickettsiella endosymbiont of Dermanyssus gallinae]|uniref:phage terminase large subunit n=1 Tax=Rickettsiella endosymbiont of Dermanyssus gallinae TaxID=2856608 RepID=UPI001C52E932|nr:phage terminase large subunit [Rickettsiella endosymbiont of Dermanyssus gallinae]